MYICHFLRKIATHFLHKSENKFENLSKATDRDPQNDTGFYVGLYQPYVEPITSVTQYIQYVLIIKHQTNPYDVRPWCELIPVIIFILKHFLFVRLKNASSVGWSMLIKVSELECV